MNADRAQPNPTKDRQLLARSERFELPTLRFEVRKKLKIFLITSHQERQPALKRQRLQPNSAAQPQS
ncbi:MAG TPA: hypothetical protein VGV62_07055, partial [Xanthobacteraceae bacterium]|nr:hypothetical protein [Xanthobacteraceae bacterium]